jgi:hypothetical protein
MSQDLTLRIAEIRIDIDGGTENPEVIQEALEAALADLARTLQASLCGLDTPLTLSFPEIALNEPGAKRFIDSVDFQRMTEAILKQIEGQIGEVK